MEAEVNEDAVITAVVAGIVMLGRELIPLVLRWNKARHREKQIDSTTAYEQVMRAFKDTRSDLAEARAGLATVTDKYIASAMRVASLEAQLRASELREQALQEQLAADE